MAYLLDNDPEHELVATFGTETAMRAELKAVHPKLFTQISNHIKSVIGANDGTSRLSSNEQSRGSRERKEKNVGVVSVTDPRATSTAQGLSQETGRSSDEQGEDSSSSNRKITPSQSSQEITSKSNKRVKGFKDLGTGKLQSHDKSYKLYQIWASINQVKQDTAEFKLFDYLISQTQNTFGRLDINVIITDNLPHDSVEGMYDNKTNNIYIRASLYKDPNIPLDKKIRLINHELIHALTETGLRQGKANNTQAYQDMVKMYEQIKAKAKGKFTKELSDIHEFIAYGLTDEKFRDYISHNLNVKNINPKGRAINSLYVFLRAVYSIFGFNTSNNFKKFAKTVDKLIVPHEAIQDSNASNGEDKQRYSQSDITSDMSIVEVIQSLDSSKISSVCLIHNIVIKKYFSQDI